MSNCRRTKIWPLLWAVASLFLVAACSVPSASPPAATLPAVQTQDMVVVEAFLSARDAHDVAAAAALMGPGATVRTSSQQPYITLENETAIAAWVRDELLRCDETTTSISVRDGRVAVARIISASSGSNCPVSAGHEIEILFTVAGDKIVSIG